jgi:hypothetical protein
MTDVEIAVKARETAERNGRENPVPHARLRSADVSKLPGIADGSTTFVPTGIEGHHTYSIPLPEPEAKWDESKVLRAWNEWWTAIDGCLGEPVDNPARRV